jgi:hypothetical protein
VWILSSSLVADEEHRQVEEVVEVRGVEEQWTSEV